MNFNNSRVNNVSLKLDRNSNKNSTHSFNTNNVQTYEEIDYSIGKPVHIPHPFPFPFSIFNPPRKITLDQLEKEYSQVVGPIEMLKISFFLSLNDATFELYLKILKRLPDKKYGENLKKYADLYAWMKLNGYVLEEPYKSKLRTLYKEYIIFKENYCVKLERCFDLSCETGVLIDAETGEIIYSNGANTRMEPASMTKVLTALVVMEHCNNLNDKVYYTDATHNAIPSDSSTAGIPSGSSLTVEDALYALLISSDNESAVALANYVCGSEEEFNKLLNEKARELGCTGTNFVNGHGYSDPNHYTTAYDMALMMQAATENDKLREIMGTYKTKTIYTTQGDPIVIKSHCDILKPTLSLGRENENYYEYAECAKTGSTGTAGQTLCVSANKDGHRYIVVLMDDDNRDKDAAELFDAVFDYYNI